MERGSITATIVARLVAEQFPEWADLPVTAVEPGGWDNVTFRLGKELLVRLPSANAYVAQIEKEHRWLPVLAAHLPLPVPQPVASGQPGATFSRPWSIYRWIEGEVASMGQVADPTSLALDLASFLAALYAVDASTGPPPGEHSFFRGGSLRTYDEQVRTSITRLPEDIDVQLATDVWEAALASEWDGEPVWVHGDVTGSNLLVTDGALSAVIDFGCAAVGDPACDLAIAWTFFSDDSREAFLGALPVDRATWARGRGWALWKALVTLVSARDAQADAARFGWRCSAREVVDAVLGDSGCGTAP